MIVTIISRTQQGLGENAEARPGAPHAAAQYLTGSSNSPTE
jgi:hypothetical protein